MRLFRAPRASGPTTSERRAPGRAAPEGDGPTAPEGAGEPDSRVLGERGISAIHRARSLQSRITNLMAFGLMSALGVGFLGWYYVHTFAAESAARHDGQAAIRRQAAGTVHLPPLGPLGSPGASRRRSLVTDVLGPPPGVPGGAKTGALSGAVSGAVSVDSGTGYRLDPAPGAEGPSTEALARARELSGPAYATRAASGAHGRSAGAASAGDGRVSGSAPGTNRFMAEPESSSPGTNPSTGRLADLLRPTVTRAARPTVLPTRRLLLPEGAFIDCTLETAIDSTLPGMTTCITATDTFGADGTVVLLPRGTALVGETRGQMQQGSSRIFVLWTEARTPGGVVIPLDSPGTDALGRSGLTGTVNRHFWQRFGAAILISVINGGIQYGVQSQSQGGALVYEPDTTEGVMTEALKSTVDIPPTVTVPNGARIEVLVARNIDFRSVYALRPTGQ